MDSSRIALIGLVMTSAAQVGLIAWAALRRPEFLNLRLGREVSETAATVEELLETLEAVSAGVLKELDTKVREGRLLAERLGARSATAGSPVAAPPPAPPAGPANPDAARRAYHRSQAWRHPEHTDGGSWGSSPAGDRTDRNAGERGTDRLSRVRTLARAGMGVSASARASASDIAREAGAGIGEVELLLNLERKRGATPA